MTQKKNRQSPDPSAEPGPGDKAVAELESAGGKDAVAHVADGDFGRYASKAPEADLNIFPLPEEELDAEFLWSLREATGSSCLFTQDSGDESALA